MISIISCSIDSGKAERIASHYHMLCGNEPHEVIRVDSPRSLADGYNRGIEASSGDIVIFSHDDIEFLEPGSWLMRLKAHLEEFDLVGLAGTTKLTSAAWAQTGPPDLPVLHESQGHFDERWQHYAQRFLHKQAGHLAPFRQRRFQHALVAAQTKDELLEIMNGPRNQWQLA
jgi:hypothetical protein